MARRPSLAAQARAAQSEAMRPLRFIADYDHVETARTVAYKAGQVLHSPPEAVKKAALAARKAVVDGK